jgi:putative MFS transporter
VSGNLRSTVATTVPNFIRGTVIPLTIAFKFLRNDAGLGMVMGALLVGLATVAIALMALRSLQETFGKDMNFVEKD